VTPEQNALDGHRTFVEVFLENIGANKQVANLPCYVIIIMLIITDDTYKL